jgi:hypothetical protein
MVEPAYLSIPDRVGSYGDEAIDLMKLAGRPLDAEQCLAVDAIMSHDRQGRWSAFEAVIIEGRQNGKTGGVLLPVTLADLYLFDADLVIWTAHEFDTATEAFRDFEQLIGGCDELARRVLRVDRSHGAEGFEFRNGARLGFRARTGKGGRGFGSKRLNLDEAMFLDAGPMGSLLPTLSARDNPQVVYGSSGAKAISSHLHQLVKRGRTGNDPGLAYVELCAPGSWDEPGCAVKGCSHVAGAHDGCALDDRTNWQAANHSLGHRLRVEVVAGERRTLPPTEFGRERLGWHEAPEEPTAPPITVEAWRSRLDLESAITDGGRVVLAAEIALDRKSGSIAAAGWRADGKAHVGLVAHDGGTDWLLPRLIELARAHRLHEIKRAEKRGPAIILDPTSPAGTLIDPLRAAGLEPVLMTSREVATSCGDMQDALTDGTVWHRDTPAVDVAIGGAVRRDLGDGGWALGRRKSAAVSVDITPAVVVFNARWGLTQAIKDYDVLASVR